MKTMHKHSYRNKLKLSEVVKLCKSRILSFDSTLKEDCALLTNQRIKQAQNDLHGLLMSLPSHLDELQHRCTSSSLFVLRAVLFIHIDQDLMTLEEADQLAPLSRILGLDELEICIVRWFENEKREYDSCKRKSLKLRNTQLMRLERGLSFLFHSPSGQALFERLNEVDRVELSGPWVRPMFRLAEHELFPRYALYALYKSTEEDQRLALLTQFEKCRRRVRVQPLPAYEKLLPELRLSELDFILAHLKALDELAKVSQVATYLPEHVQLAVERMMNRMDEVS